MASGRAACPLLVITEHSDAFNRRDRRADLQALCREHNITETTFYRWRNIYGGMTISEASRLKE
jgi:hypothetical protein